MSPVSRFLNHRRDRRSKRTSTDGRQVGLTKEIYDVFTVPDDEKKKRTDKHEQEKVKTIIQRLTNDGIVAIREPQVEYALRAESVKGDVEKAIQLLLVLEASVNGELRRFHWKTALVGAENRENVTCYLDSLLFSMFCQLESFEPMIGDHPHTPERCRLAALIRLWVNMLREGFLITKDITEHLQNALAACGWTDASKIMQQDVSEAFAFITEQMGLPLLTLKMDLYHTGKEDAKDDHKLVNERILEVAVPDAPEDGSMLTLEGCLESYFNSRVEVRRHLHRRNTLQSVRSFDSEKGRAVHVESLEVPQSEASTPTVAAPIHAEPLMTRPRQDSIFGFRRESAIQPGRKERAQDDWSVPYAHPAVQKFKREVLMPAWQFFKLIPWSTSTVPQTDEQVAAHFASSRPVVGICLKRYSVTPNGESTRKSTRIDIPLRLAIPHFISEGDSEDQEPYFKGFRLMLEAVICHRGKSVDSGHYVCLVRPTIPGRDPAAAAAASLDAESQWMLFDDLEVNERVRWVNIHKALEIELPYLLFYRILPVEDTDLDSPPTYAEANGYLTPNLPRIANSQATTPMSMTDLSVDTLANSLADLSNDPVRSRAPTDSQASSSRPSISSSQPRSLAFGDESIRTLDAALRPLQSSSRGVTAPTTPADDSRSTFLGMPRLGRKMRSGAADDDATPAASAAADPSLQSRSSPRTRASEERRLSLPLSRLSKLSTERLSMIGHWQSSSGSNMADPNVAVVAGASEDGSATLVDRAEKGKSSEDPSRGPSSSSAGTTLVVDGHDIQDKDKETGIRRLKSRKGKLRLRSKSRKPPSVDPEDPVAEGPSKSSERECSVM